MDFALFCFIPGLQYRYHGMHWSSLTNKDICIIIVRVLIRSGPLTHMIDVSVYLGRGGIPNQKIVHGVLSHVSKVKNVPLLIQDKECVC